MTAPPVVLASASAARRRLLADAGIDVTADAPRVDEDSVKAAFRADGAGPGDAAEALAEMKAQRVTTRHPGAFVIGADQVLICEGHWFDKPADRADAAAHLRALSGRRHQLVVTAVVVRDATRLWHYTDRAELAVRPLSDAFIESYLDAAGPAVLHSVGAYQLEGRGAQLFTEVRGDFFTVLGLPLLPLLGFLREHKVVAT